MLYFNKVLICIEVSRAVLGIMALMGNEILVRFKLPDKIFFPIYLTISFPTPLILDFTPLSEQIWPPL